MAGAHGGEGARLARWMVRVRVVRARVGEGGVDWTPKALGPYCGFGCDSKWHKKPLVGFEFGDVM